VLSGEVQAVRPVARAVRQDLAKDIAVHETQDVIEVAGRVFEVAAGVRGVETPPRAHSVARCGLLDMRAQAEQLSAPRSDTRMVLA
jgi:hypothetical protein